VLLHLIDELEICGIRTLAEARKFRVRQNSRQSAMQLALDS
jgi:hypothetical protein